MQVDASDVSQPQNPGDALIRKYKIIGPAPDTRHWVTLDGLELTASSDFGNQKAPAFVIEIRNTGEKAIHVDSSEVGPALLGLSPKAPHCASDGKSGAWITRGDLVHWSSWESGTGNTRYSASYTVDSESPLPERFQLSPGQSKRVRLILKVPPGQYQFMVGYGGGVHEEKSLASNAISFDLNESGIATLALGTATTSSPLIGKVPCAQSNFGG